MQSDCCCFMVGCVSWRSADGEDAVCESCQMLEQFRQKQKVEGQNEAQAASVQMELGEPELRTSGSMCKNLELSDLCSINLF